MTNLLHVPQVALKIGRILCLIFWVLQIWQPYVSRGDQTPALFEAGNRAYEEGRFAEAITNYSRMVSSGQVSAAIFFNLGNAYFKSGQLGRAIASYLNAERLAPRDPDIKANLEFARKQSKGPSWSSDRLFRALGQLSINEWTALAVCALWMLFLLLTLREVRPNLKASLRNPVLIAVFACVVLWAMAGTALERANSIQIAIVTAPEAIVRHGPLQESQNAFTAHDGSELRILDQKDQWLQVSAGPGRVGWIPEENLVVLRQ